MLVNMPFMRKIDPTSTVDTIPSFCTIFQYQYSINVLKSVNKLCFGQNNKKVGKFCLFSLKSKQ